MKRLLILLAAFGLALGAAHAAPASSKSAPATVEAAIEAAAPKQKLIFISYGREACGNCRHLRTLIEEKELRLSDTDWVKAEIDCDNPETRKEFNKRYRKELDGARTLPFVVVTKADGTYVASIAGYQKKEAYEKFVRDAKSAAKKSATPVPAKP